MAIEQAIIAGVNVASSIWAGEEKYKAEKDLYNLKKKSLGERLAQIESDKKNTITSFGLVDTRFRTDFLRNEGVAEGASLLSQQSTGVFNSLALSIMERDRSEKFNTMTRELQEQRDTGLTQLANEQKSVEAELSALKKPSHGKALFGAALSGIAGASGLMGGG